MIDEHLKILKFMSEMTVKTDTNAFAQKMGLTSAQLVHHMQDLVKQGYLKRVGEGFAMTEKGKKALKSLKPLPENLNFHFYLAVGEPVNLHAASVKEFHDQVVKVNVVSLEFHVYRGDFENWFQNAVGDAAFAEELSKLKKKNLKGEELRKALIKAIGAEFIF
jgi:DNA-binding MarR family transcriptional regulator